MIVSSVPASDRNKNESDANYGNLYSVLSANYVKFKGDSIKMIKLRNPWLNTGINPKSSW